jgi:hypothetical protein
VNVAFPFCELASPDFAVVLSDLSIEEMGACARCPKDGIQDRLGTKAIKGQTQVQRDTTEPAVRPGSKQTNCVTLAPRVYLFVGSCVRPMKPSLAAGHSYPQKDQLAICSLNGKRNGITE